MQADPLRWKALTVVCAAFFMTILDVSIVKVALPSIVMTTFEEGAERNKALGIWGALGGGGAAVGVLACGVLTTYLGWEWIFFVNVPVGAIAFLLAPRFVRESRADEKKSLDIAGAVTVTTGLALLVYAVSKAPDHGWGSAWTLIPLGVAAVLLLAFVGIEATTKDPLMPFNIFRIKTVTGANVCGLLLGAITFANFYLLTLYVQQVLGYSAIKTGLTFVVTAGSAVLWAGLAQSLTPRLGVKPVLAAGFVAMTAGAIWYTQIPADGSFVTALLPGYLLIGFGLPFTFIPVSIAALAGVSHDEAGLASGLINTTQQIGGAVGIAVCASVSLSRFNHLMALHGPRYYAQALTSGTALAFWVLV